MMKPTPRTAALNLNSTQDDSSMLILGLLFIVTSLSAYDAPPYGGAQNPALQELQREVRNQKQSLQTIQSAQENWAIILEGFSKEFKENTKNTKERLSHTLEGVESKIPPLESSIKALSSDLKQMKTLLNEISDSLGQMREKISHLEKQEKSDAHKLTHLENSLQQMMEALAPTPSGLSGNRYTVKSGDSLEKIARRNNVSIRALKEANNLSSDQIRVGQSLIMPP